jgi:cationic peptide transport system substrate-binding protein
MLDYQRNQEMIYNQVPVIPLAHALMVSAYMHNIQDVELPPTGGVSFKRAYFLPPGGK